MQYDGWIVVSVQMEETVFTCWRRYIK